MEITLIIKAFLALVFVLGLLFVTVWGLKYCELKGAKNRFFQKMRSQRRLEIIETQPYRPAQFAGFGSPRQQGTPAVAQPRTQSLAGKPLRRSR